jgi:hypothetical protein
MGVLEKTQFGDWTDYGYASFYKRYVQSLQVIARKRFGCSAEDAQALAHSFVADQACAPSGGLLHTYDRGRRFRPYLLTSFYNYCYRELKPSGEELLEFDPAAPASDQPEWSTLAQEAEALRCKVRKAIHIARVDLLSQGRLDESERSYLLLKWPEDHGASPLSDREIGERLEIMGLLAPKSSSALTRAACRLGERVGKKLLYNLRRLLRDEYQRHMPEGEVSEATTMSLKTIVHVLGLEEESI